ncbi:MAG: thioesterase II family protein [Desulfobacterales bacterium]|jgi:medium-chain acyl-[acyl-carrier-protein] hydrolase
MNMKNDVWIKRSRQDPQTRFRLFCFPYAGGGASFFRTWRERLGPDIEVCAVQLPGREERLTETPFVKLSSLIDVLTEVLYPYLDLPFAFFGHSLGSLISFELTRRLRRQKAPGPMQLFVSGHRAPQIPDPDPPIHHLPDAEFIEELGRFNGTPKAVLENPELMEVFMPLLRSDIGLDETYVYDHEAPLDCPISAFGGLEDKEVSREELAGWHDQTRSRFNIQMFPGDHFFLNGKKSDDVLEIISKDIRKLSGKTK